jgi:hypothetical protein
MPEHSVSNMLNFVMTITSEGQWLTECSTSQFGVLGSFGDEDVNISFILQVTMHQV